MGNDLMSYRANIGSFYVKAYSTLYSSGKRCNVPFWLFLVRCICLSNVTILCYIYFRLILAGDVHLNPGPTTKHTDQLSFCCINCRSILSHENKLAALDSLLIQNYSIIALTETWLNEDIDDPLISLSGYNCFRKDRDSRAGGVALYVKDTLIVKHLDLLDTVLTETVWVKISTNRGTLVFGVCYCPQAISEHALNSNLFIEYLQTTFDTINDLNSNGYIQVGDFNAKDVRWGFTVRNNALGHRLFDFVSDQGAEQLIKEPTRITRDSESLLDLIITNMSGLFTESGTLPPLYESCDHCIIHGKLNMLIQANTTYYKEFFNSNNVNWVALNTALETADWENCYTVPFSLDSSIENWIKLLHQIIKIHIPVKRIKITSRDKQWITPFVKHCINKRHRLFKKAKISNSRVSWELYNTADKEYTRAISTAKQEYYSHLYESLNDPNICRKKWWKLVKTAYSTNESSTVPDLNVNNRVVENPVEKCNIFNEFFSSQSSVDDSNANLPELIIPDTTLNIPVISRESVLKV
jgi:hypothetical protein